MMNIVRVVSSGTEALFGRLQLLAGVGGCRMAELDTDQARY